MLYLREIDTVTVIIHNRRELRSTMTQAGIHHSIILTNRVLLFDERLPGLQHIASSI